MTTASFASPCSVCGDPPDACGTVAPCGAPVDDLLEAKDAPIAIGGDIVPGTYELLAKTVYTGPGGATGPGPDEPALTVLVFDASGTYAISLARASGTSLLRESGSYTLSGAQLTMVPKCPRSGEASSVQYTAAAEELRLYFPPTPLVQGVSEWVLTRQPM
ncbi:MAG: hypothetical protein U0414_03065 [Polyangiaceae bacterium]